MTRKAQIECEVREIGSGAADQPVQCVPQSLPCSISMHRQAGLFSKDPAQMVQRRSGVARHGFESDGLGQVSIEKSTRTSNQPTLPLGRHPSGAADLLHLLCAALTNSIEQGESAGLPHAAGTSQAPGGPSPIFGEIVC